MPVMPLCCAKRQWILPGDKAMRNFYLFASIAGFFVPYAAFLGWLDVNGFNVSLFFSSIFADSLSLFAWSDVFFTAIVLVVFIVVEGTRMELPRLWVPVAATCLVGPSLGLPLFLYQRQSHIDARLARAD